MKLSHNKIFDWDVIIKPIMHENTLGKVISSNKEIQLIRNDNGTILSTRSTDKHILTNKLFEDLILQIMEFSSLDMEIDYASERKGGKQVLVFLKHKKTYSIDQSIGLQNSMVIGHSFDQSLGVFIGISSQVIPEKSTLNLIIKDHTFRHTSQLQERLNGVNSILAIYESREKHIVNIFQKALYISASRELLDKYIYTILRVDPNNIDTLSTRKANQITSLRRSILMQFNRYGHNLFSMLYGVLYHTNFEESSKSNSPTEQIIKSSQTFNKQRLAFSFIEKIILEE